MTAVCQLCNEAKATVHITDTAPQKRERHLCENCAVKEGVIIKPNIHQTTNEILQQFIEQKVGAGAASDLACPRCGRTFREFQLKGLLGCPHDYEAFDKLLAPLLERAHDGGSHHVGKVPITAESTVKQQTDLLRLRRELGEAIAREDYEEAAKLRDQIKLLEEQ